MKITKIINMRRVLSPVFQEKMSPRLSYKIMKLISKTDEDEVFYNKNMAGIIRDCCVKGKDGKIEQSEGGYKIDPAKKADCEARIKELDETEAEDVEIKFTLDELSELKLSPRDMLILDDFIEE